MFSSKNKGGEASPPVPASPAQKQARPGRAAPSIISADVVLVGNITSGGDIQIDGTVEGDIRSTSLTVGEKATINGEIVADDVVIRGRVMGSVRARRVQLCSNCHVEGNILHEALAVETGAFFEGNCRHSADPMADDGKGGTRKTSAKGSGVLGGLMGKGPDTDNVLHPEPLGEDRKP